MLGEILNEGLRKGFVKKVRTPRHGNIPGRGHGKCRGSDDCEEQEEASVPTL